MIELGERLAVVTGGGSGLVAVMAGRAVVERTALPGLTGSDVDLSGGMIA